MSRKEDEAFAAWVEEMAGKVEASEAEAFKVWAKTDAARETFRGTIGQTELYRRFNELDREKRELAEDRTALEEWYEAEKPKNAALLAERDELRRQLAELGSGAPPPALSTPAVPGLTPEKLAELEAKANKAEVLDKLIPAVLGDMAKVLQDSSREGLDVDPREVIKYSLQHGVEPYRAFLDLTADQRQKQEETRQEAERKKWFEEGRRSALSHNSPDHLQPSGPSVVDYLRELNKSQAQGTPQSRSELQDARVSAAMKELAEGNYMS